MLRLGVSLPPLIAKPRLACGLVKFAAVGARALAGRISKHLHLTSLCRTTLLFLLYLE